MRDLTGGLGADRIVDVGGPATIAQSVRSIREGGQVSIVGALGMEGEAIDIMKLFFSQAIYKIISVGNRNELEEMNRAVAAHQIRPVIESVFAFEDAHSAYDRLGSETSSARSLFATDDFAHFQGDFAMTAYAIFIRERSRNAAELQIYAELVTPLLGESGATMLAAYGALDALEGAVPEGVVMASFPTMDAARAFYDSPEYQSGRRLSLLHHRRGQLGLQGYGTSI
ncbi:uncharacterized protein (DUF1330 family) [Rhizobium sp. BK379]|nr:uncharacterized protein (DUF1330 family) [Rhizobium sp. BK379]